MGVAKTAAAGRQRPEGRGHRLIGGGNAPEAAGGQTGPHRYPLERGS